uniref:NADH-ubiquinone oxidoreductase chain 6 n=1 Tax=Eurypogon sp. EUR01 TaxID=1205553 RepID=A0A0S2MQW3_9COLE|nr:NADH deshydrogenase subunit 6 [Eurypogon sp. EUR01]
MTEMMLTTMLMLAIMMPWFNHPLSVGMLILIQTIMVALITGFYSMNFWFSYIIFLVMIGGLLILFIYMTSIASNEKFSYSSTMMKITMMYMLMTMLLMKMTDKFMMNQETVMDNFKMNDINMFSLTLNKFINFPTASILMMIIIYLFVTLIAVVKIVYISKGPLRQKN